MSNINLCYRLSLKIFYKLDAEGFKIVADVLVQEAGITPMLHRLFVEPIMDGNTIIGIITESKAGREALLAKRVIDASGDADIAYRAGVATHLTPKEDMQAASVMFHMSGVDKQRFMAGVKADPQTYRNWEGGEWKIETTGKEDTMFSPFLRKPFEQAIQAGVIPADLTTIGGTWGAVHDSGEMTYMNLVHLDNCDGTDPNDLTYFEIEGRRQALLAIEAMRQFSPGCEQARLRNFGMTLGIKVAHAATRNMGCCAVLGQGAGIAAALSIKQDVKLKRLRVKGIQQALDRQGVRYF